jgi:CRISPR-associated endonuclease/helicase Cas3
MSKLDIKEFTPFFVSLYGDEPFPWQKMLLERVQSEGWPDLIDLPTASGKTACMDVAIFALAMGLPTPRRIWFVVDRRIVVDEAYRRAERLSLYLKYVVSSKTDRKQLESDPSTAGILKGVNDVDHTVLIKVAKNLIDRGGAKPLELGRLRGGVPRSVAWAGNPAQPAIITSTVDQIGSRLLFRGYGVSEYAWPIHAALAGTDSLILLDEAHLAGPFYETVQAIERYRLEPWATEPLPTPFKLVVMSATLPGKPGDSKRFPEINERNKALNHPKLNERRSILKPTELAIAKKPKIPKEFTQVDDDELVVDAAVRAINFISQGRRRIAIMVNRVRTARNIAKQLEHVSPVLITGRLRPIDRDELITKYESRLKAGSKEVLTDAKDAVVIVTTQCLEVGADFSFDALITECASLDALRQRFGRLARLGTPVDAPGVVLIRKVDTNLEPKEPDPIYGPALPKTWEWLDQNVDVKQPASINMGIDAIDPKLPEDLRPYRAPERHAPILLPAYLDMLCQTSPRPAIEPDVSLFLHGIPPADERVRAEVKVVWRDNLVRQPDGTTPQWKALVEGLPPLNGEMLSVPLTELRRLLDTGRDGIDPKDSDVESGFESIPSREKSETPATSSQNFVISRGRDYCKVATDVSAIRPNDVIVLPADHSSFRQLVLYQSARPDVYEQAYRNAHGVIRKLYQPELPDTEPDEEAVIASIRLRLTDEDKKLFEEPRFLDYAPGYFHITGKAPRIPVDEWQSDTEEDDLLYVEDRSKSLAGHTKDVVCAAKHLAGTLLEPYANIMTTAADLHDVGKADGRFQYLLHHGRPVDPAKLRAKSEFRLGQVNEHKLYQLSGLPEGFRHELLSVQMVLLDQGMQDHSFRDLILHLIASHHGRCRPFAPVIIDEKAESVDCTIKSCAWSISAEQRAKTLLHRLDSNVAARFWKLTRQYGWWGLAYLESILRCADTHASAYAEQESR